MPDIFGGAMRPVSESEKPLVAWLFESACRPESVEVLEVETMNDGGMGSIRIGPFGGDRRFGATVAETVFHDEDGTLVLASLNVDSRNELYEVDIWRVDFGPLRRWPASGELSKAPEK
jgi:hypothetical protein